MNVKVWTWSLIVITIFALTALGCTPSGPNSGEKDIRGSITSVTENGTRKIILIEGQLAKDTKFDKAAVTVTDKTNIYQTDTGKSLGREALIVGAKVEAVFTGPIAESYPVQVTAKEIIVLK